MRIVSTLLVFGLAIFFALEAFAQEPLGWRYTTEGRNVELELSAYEDLSGLEMVIYEGGEDDAAQSRHARSLVRAGQRWKVVRPAPSAQEYWRVQVTGELRGVDFNAWYAFPVGPPATIDFELVRYLFDGDEKWLIVRPSAQVDSAIVRVHGESGRVIYEGERPLSADAGDEVKIDIDVNERVLVVDVILVATSGATREYRYTPWELRTEARSLNFETGSARLHADDRAALDSSYDVIAGAVARLGQVVALELYVGGYTDSVGPREMNRELSRERAQTIARYMRDKGLRIPIYFQGFGEGAPAVDLGDEAESGENRRAVFLLRVGAPETGPLFPESDWKRLR